MITFRQAVFLLLLPALRAAGQDVPAASATVPYTGFALPDVSGTVRYSINASERYLVGYNVAYDGTGGGNGTSASVSGTAAYLSSSPTDPFSAVYTGSFSQGGVDGPNGLSSTLSLSQIAEIDRWRFVGADTVSYSPGNPITGLSGIPGLGDANVPSLPGSSTGLDIQTVNVPILSNQVSGTASYAFSPSTSFSGTAFQNITRYINSPGGSTTDENSLSFSSNLGYQIDPFTSVGLAYSHMSFVYLFNNFKTTSQTVSVNGRRQLTPYLTVTGSIGPQFLSSSNPAIQPSSTSYSANGSISYTNNILNATLSAGRGSSAGSGLVAGTESTSISGRADRQISDYAHVTGSFSYTSFSGLQTSSEVTHSFVATGQANRSIISHVSAFISYTFQRQLNQGPGISSLALNGDTQTFALGVTYSPDAIHIGRQ